MTEIQQRTAEQLFRTLGELKGGAMKFGQALSVLESALPEEVAAPYREQLTKLQDAAPPMPTQTVRDALARDLGPGLEGAAGLARRRSRPPPRRSARSTRAAGTTGARSRSRCSTRAPATRSCSDLRQALPARPHHRRLLVPGIEIRPLIAELQARATDEGSTTTSRREAQTAFAEAFTDDPDIVVPARGRRQGPSLITEWLESPASLAQVIPRRHPGGARPLRRAARPLPLRGPVRAPGCCTPTRTPGTSGCCPAADEAGPPRRPRLRCRGPPGRRRSSREAMGRLIRIAGLEDRRRRWSPACARRSFVKDRINLDPGAAPRLPVPVRGADPGRALPLLARVDAGAVPADQQPRATRRTPWP